MVSLAGRGIANSVLLPPKSHVGFKQVVSHVSEITVALVLRGRLGRFVGVVNDIGEDTSPGAKVHVAVAFRIGDQNVEHNANGQEQGRDDPECFFHRFTEFTPPQ